MSRKPPTKQQAIDAMYDLVVNNRCDFENEWTGWRMRGQYLIAPTGDRISVKRLSGLLFVQSLSKPKPASVAPMRSGGCNASTNVVQLGSRRRVA